MIHERLSARRLSTLYWIGVLAPGLFLFTSLQFGWPPPWSPPTTWLGPALSAAVVWRTPDSAKGRAIRLVAIPAFAFLAFAAGLLLAGTFGPGGQAVPD